MKELIKNRTKKFAVAIINFSNLLPNKQVGWNISNQIIRSATSVGANYRAVCRAKSDRDFISKMETVIEEADETLFWLEIIEETNIISEKNQIQILKKEANELISMFVSSVITVKKRLNKKH
jgi:four helix bundle protein